MQKLFQMMFLGLAVVVGSAHASDTGGGFFIAGGAGGVTCPNFVSVMERARLDGTGSVAYANETQGFTMYILGFETGYNMAEPSTYDVFPNETTAYPLLSWVENWCRVHPTAHFGEGVVALAKHSYPMRQQIQPAEPAASNTSSKPMR